VLRETFQPRANNFSTIHARILARGAASVSDRIAGANEPDCKLRPQRRSEKNVCARLYQAYL